jgi:hypothetical protein
MTSRNYNTIMAYNSNARKTETNISSNDHDGEDESSSSASAETFSNSVSSSGAKLVTQFRSYALSKQNSGKSQTDQKVSNDSSDTPASTAHKVNESSLSVGEIPAEELSLSSQKTGGMSGSLPSIAENKNAKITQTKESVWPTGYHPSKKLSDVLEEISMISGSGTSVSHKKGSQEFSKISSWRLNRHLSINSE